MFSFQYPESYGTYILNPNWGYVTSDSNPATATKAQ